MRTEHDFLGTMELADDYPFGIHTRRAEENFRFSADRMRIDLFLPIIEVKRACARANREAGLLDAERADLIERACVEILSSSHHVDHVVPDIHPLQGGAGTSSNMAANELIANTALCLSGRSYGEYDYISPLGHVNLSQSTNDVYPTAAKIAVIRSLRTLHDASESLLSALLSKEKEFSHILKIGRTEMQEAMPLSLGAGFGAWAESISRFRWRLSKAVDWVREVNISGTAVGTGVNADIAYASAVIRELRELTQEPLSLSRNLVDGTQNIDQIVEVSGIVKTGAVSVKKICSDLRILSSGPRSGIAELSLPQMQSGSSIMPGKVNPVICEAAEQVCLSVMTSDSLVATAAAESNLELPQFFPLIAHTILSMNEMFAGAMRALAPHIEGIRANEKNIRMHLERSAALATLLSPAIGYDNAALLVKESEATGGSIAELAVAKGFISREKLARIMRPEILASRGIIDLSEDKNGI